VTAAAKALDIDDTSACSIEAHLYKLLLYEQGGHFAAHQDTEKERGMIGTLVVQLPCCEGHSGGSLAVRHRGMQYVHDFAQVRHSQWAAGRAGNLCCEQVTSSRSTAVALQASLCKYLISRGKQYVHVFVQVSQPQSGAGTAQLLVVWG
jgi:hypothetical protein